MNGSYAFGDWTELVVDGGSRITLQAAPGKRHFYPQANSRVTLQNITLTGGNTTGELARLRGFDPGRALRRADAGERDHPVEHLRRRRRSCVSTRPPRPQSATASSPATPQPAYGGGINNLGTLTVTGGEVAGNSALRGGGIHTGGPVTDPSSPMRSASLTSVAVVGNTATSSSGGVYSHSEGDFAMVSSTVSGNSATGTNAPIGGVAVVGTGYIVASTIANNTAKYPLNAAGLSASSSTQIANTVITGNMIDQPAPTPDTLANCTPVASGRAYSLGGNVESGASCGFTGAGNLSNADPQLEPLANNGGSSRTHAVPPGSVLVDAVPTANEIYSGSTDQRGVGNMTTGQRALDGNGVGGAQSDVGAYELQPDTVSPKTQGLVASSPNPVTAETAAWNVTFSEPVVGVDASDFLTANTGLSGVEVQSLSPASGPATSYTVTVTSGTGEGTLRLDLVDDDSIRDVYGNRLGGNGIGNGNTTGDTVTVHRGPAAPPPPPSNPPPPPPTTDPPPANPVTAPVTGPGTAPVTAPVPTATVAVKAVRSRSYLFIDVEPNKGSGYWKVRVQRKKPDGSWKALKSYKTKGSKETRTINLPKGTYRLVVTAKYGFQGSTSPEVYLKR